MSDVAKTRTRDLTEVIKASPATRAEPRARSVPPRRAAASESPRLGKNRKSASTPSQTASEEAAQALHSQRRLRFQLQRVAGQILVEEINRENIASVHACGRSRRRDTPGQSLPIRKGEDGRAYVTGVQRCGNVHCCPVCAARIANRRRLECISALSQWRASGGFVYMLTLTLPHRADQSMASVLQAVSACTRYLNSGRNAMKSLLSDYGYIGQIRSLEVTQGSNGWHPHLHVLVLTESAVPDELVPVFKAQWESAAISHGWSRPSDVHGLTWQGGDKAAEYVNKAGTWGMAEEISMQHVSKQGSSGSRTPFELLQDAALGDVEAVRLFREYGMAVRGKRQQFWSEGLKKRFGIGDVSDVEAAEEENQEHEQVAVIAPDEWRLVVRYEERAELLRAVEAAGQVGVQLVVSWLKDRQRADQWRRMERLGTHARVAA